MDFLKSNLEHNKASWQWDLLLWSFFVLENFKGRRKFSSTFWTWNQWGFQIQVRIRSVPTSLRVKMLEKSTNLIQKGNIFEHAMFWDTIYFSQMKPPHGPEQEHAYTYSFPGTILPFFKPTEYCIKLVLEKSYWKKLLVGFSDLFSRTFKLWQSKKHSIS